MGCDGAIAARSLIYSVSVFQQTSVVLEYIRLIRLIVKFKAAHSLNRFPSRTKTPLAVVFVDKRTFRSDQISERSVSIVISAVRMARKAVTGGKYLQNGWKSREECDGGWGEILGQGCCENGKPTNTRDKYGDPEQLLIACWNE